MSHDQTGKRQPDRKTLMKQAKQGAAVMWCTECDYSWREWFDTLGWPGGHPGGFDCPKCFCIYTIWENYPEWASLHNL